MEKVKFGKDGYYYLSSKPNAFFKYKKNAKKYAKMTRARIKRTNHVIRGKGWLVYK